MLEIEACILVLKLRMLSSVEREGCGFNDGASCEDLEEGKQFQALSSDYFY